MYNTIKEQLVVFNSIVMETHQGTDTRFASQIGGYLSVTASDITHTQDFITYHQDSNQIPDNTSSYFGSFQQTLREILGDCIDAASIFQNYKINSLTAIISINLNLPGDAARDYWFAIAPWNRSPYSTGTTFSNTDPRSIGGCQAKTFRSSFENPTGGDTIEVTQPNPCYAVPTLSSTTLADGEQYSNKPLSLLTSYGVDNTNWFFFLYMWGLFSGGTPGQSSLIFNWLIKLNITFTGLRWNPGGLFIAKRLNHRYCENALVPHRPYENNREDSDVENNSTDTESPICSSVRDSLGLHNTKIPALPYATHSRQSLVHFGLHRTVETNNDGRRRLVQAPKTVSRFNDRSSTPLHELHEDERTQLDRDWGEGQINTSCRENSPPIEKIKLQCNTRFSEEWSPIFPNNTTIPLDVCTNTKTNEISSTKNT